MEPHDECKTYFKKMQGMVRGSPVDEYLWEKSSWKRKSPGQKSLKGLWPQRGTEGMNLRAKGGIKQTSDMSLNYIYC